MDDVQFVHWHLQGRFQGLGRVGVRQEVWRMVVPHWGAGAKPA